MGKSDIHQRAAVATSRRFGKALAWLALPLLALPAACDLMVSTNVSLNNLCQSESDCPSGQVCFSPGAGAGQGTCQNECMDNQDCPYGLTCDGVTGQKACTAPTPDASPDASIYADATTSEAQAPDATTDAPTALDATDASDAYEAGDANDATVDAAGADDGATTDGEGGADDVFDASDSAAVNLCKAGAPPSTLVLFGGSSSQGTDLNDTWVWDGSSWSQQDLDAGDAAPPARRDAVMSTACGYAILAGGTVGPAPLMDAWQWNGSVWQPAAAPLATYSSVAGTLGGTMYIFGGIFGTIELQEFSSSLYAWQGGSWSLAPQTTPSGLGANANATFASTPDGLLLFGGGAASDSNKTWLLTDANWIEENYADGSAPPAARKFATAARWGNSVVMFGGQDAKGQTLPDTWIWDGSTWTVVQAQPTDPPARYAAVMGSLNGQVVLFGGIGIDTLNPVLSDTWIWNGSWSPGPSAGPSARSNAAMTAY